MASTNLNQLLSSDITQNNINIEGPPSPILSTNKINRRITNRKLNRQKSKINVNQFAQDVEHSNSFDQNFCLSENQITATEKLKNERKKYYDLLCSMYSTNDAKNTCENKEHKKLMITHQHEYVEKQEHKSNCVPNQNHMKFSIQTAAGRKVEIPEHVINECKYIFDDILSDQTSNVSILKCPIKSNITKLSRIPIWNHSSNTPTSNSMAGSNCLQIHNEETHSQLEAIKEIVSNEEFDEPYCISLQKETCESVSGNDVLITESFINAAQNMFEEDKQMGMLDSEYVESNYSTNTMNCLYSNQKFEEFSTTDHSVGCFSYSDSVRVVGEVSEVSVESLQFSTNNPNSHLCKNATENAKILTKTTGNKHITCEDLSIRDVINDDWSDTVYVVDSNRVEETKTRNTKNENHIRVNGILNTQRINHCDNSAEITTNTANINQNDGTSKHVNECNISKSIINLSIPTTNVNSDMEALDSKRLIELHRNKNFLGTSEESCTNIDYKVSQHSIHVERKSLKAEKKIVRNDFIGFDKQEFINQSATALANNIKQIEKEIIDKELFIQARIKCDKNTKLRKNKRNKSESEKIDNDKEKPDTASIATKECKMKHDKKKREKTRHDKIKPGDDLSETAYEQITTNEEINRTVTYDRISIVSEQSCKKYKDNKKRKTLTTDKIDTISPNKNQTIELSPNKKKFKIEIDCNNKFRINISCNGMQCDKENIKTDFKALEDSSMKGSLEDTVATLNKKQINEAKNKLDGMDTFLDKQVDTSRKKDCHENLMEVQKIYDYCDLNSVGKDKLIKRVLNKAHKLYRDIRKSDVLLNPEQKLEKMREIDSDMKSIQKINDNSMQANHSGFKSASGKDIKVSMKSLKTAEKMYKDTEKQSNENNQHKGHNANAIDQKPKESEPSKQRIRVLYTDVDNTNPNENIMVTEECKKDVTNIEPEKISPQSTNIQNFENKILQTNAYESRKPESICGFQSASGRNINLSSGALEKAKRLFDENNFPAGDSSNFGFSGFKSASGKNIQISEEHLAEAKKMYDTCDNTKLCMGDFQENLPAPKDDQKIKSSQEKTSESLKGNSSKKAFEILEDVVETVDCALEKIQKNKNQPLNKKRLGISRCKQINISKEKIDKARRLFSSDSFNESVKELPTTTPLKAVGALYNSTPIREHAPHKKDGNLSKSTIEWEITPIKQIDHEPISCRTNDAVGDSDILLCQKTPGSLDDWYTALSKQINSLKEVLNNLEGKKSNIQKQMSVLHYGDKDHRKRRSGVLHKAKTRSNRRVPLKTLKTDLTCINTEQCSTEGITSQNADMIHFNCNRIEKMEPTQDSAIVIPNAQNLVGLAEIEMAFRTMPGVEPELIPNKWIANHYRLIVWKLASYERFFPKQLDGSLTIENVIQQLKYRYDREVDRAERPAIRKILEKDDVPQKRMVLCVSNIFEVSNNRKELELTDGWYCIRTIIDNPLMYQIRREKIRIGTKLIINSAQLLNCDGCHPLEVPDFVKLSITYNCTRRTIWHAKLGYQKCPEPFPIPLSSIHPEGGLIGCIKVNIIRVYPIRYMEQIEDKKVWRNSKAEEKRANEFENERLEKMERIHYSIQEIFEKDLCLDMKNKMAERLKLNRTEILKITCPKTLYSLLESANDPESLMEMLSPSQRVSVLEYRQHVSLQREQEISRRISEEMEKLKLAKRKVIPILKLLVLDSYGKSQQAQQFCIWYPKEEDLSLLKEGISVAVYNVLPRANGDLFSNSKTHFITGKNCTTFSKFRRQIFPIMMALDPHYQPFFNEFDTIGLVIKFNINTHDQDLWIADCLGRLLYIKIKDGPKMCSLLDGIMKGQIISLLNLIYCNSQKEYGQALANQFTVISNCSHQNYLQEFVEQMKLQLPKDLSQFISECEQKIEKCTLRLEMKQNVRASSMQQNLLKSFNNSIFETSDDTTLISSRLTATDLAMSLIDTDKFT